MDWIRAGKLAVISLGVYLLFRFLLPFMFPFLAALFLVRLLRDWIVLARKYFHLKKQIAVLLFSVGTLALLLGSAYRLILCVSAQGSRLIGFCRECMPEWRNSFWGLLGNCDAILGLPAGALEGMLTEKLEHMLELLNGYFLERLPNQLIQAAAACIGFFIMLTIVVMASLLLYQDYDNILAEIRRQRWYPMLSRIRSCVSESGAAYLKTQGIILLCTIVYNAVGLHLLGYSDTIFLGILIGIVDFLPILGAGTILIPWLLLVLLQGNIAGAAGLGVIYLLCFLTRQYLEPKLMGKQNGLRPFYMFVCIYLGMKLFGLWGVFLGPLGVALIQGVYQEWGADARQ